MASEVVTININILNLLLSFVNPKYLLGMLAKGWPKNHQFSKIAIQKQPTHFCSNIIVVVKVKIRAILINSIVCLIIIYLYKVGA